MSDSIYNGRMGEGMKSRGLNFLMCLVVATLASATAHARPDETDLKSDLELELEGKSTKKKPQLETPVKKEKAPTYKVAPLAPQPTRIVVPEPEPPPPQPTAAPTPDPTPMPTPAATPVPHAAPVARPASPPPPAPAPPQEPVVVIAPPKPTVRGPAPANIESRLSEAQRLYDQKYYDRAIDLLRPLNDHLPRSGLLLLAKCYAAVKDNLNELRTLELCIAKNPKDYVVQVVYGQALVRAKRVEDGLLAFQEARKLNPRYRPAYEAELKELEAKGERYEARNVVSDMIKKFGAEPEFFTNLCRLYWADAFHEKVVEFCEKATEKAPHVPENYVYLGLSLIDREELERSHRILTMAAKKFPTSEAVQSAMGELYLTKKDYVQAFTYYRRAAKADTKSARAWVGYGAAAFELQKNDDALEAFTKACAINKTMTKEFRSAIGKLRVRKDVMWQSKFESGINGCQ